MQHNRRGDTPPPHVPNSVAETTLPIPLEIIGEIFTQVLPPVMDEVGRGELIKLCLVSRHWNDAARRTPTLWSNLRIILGYATSYPFRNVIKWFHYSGVAPKTLTIFVLPHYMQCRTPERCRLTQSGLLHLFEEGPALKELRIITTSGRCYRNLIRSVPNRSLWDNIGSVSFTVTGEVPLNSTKFLCLGMPRSLTALELHLPNHRTTSFDRDYPANLASFEIPPELLNPVTSFFLRCNWEASPTVLTALQHCVNVTTLTLNLENGRMQCDAPFVESLSRDGLLLPNLRNMRLQQCRPSEATKLLNILKAPNIVQLDVSFEPYEASLEHHQYQYLDHTCMKLFEDDPYFRCPRIENDNPYEVDEPFAQAIGVFVGRSPPPGARPTLRSLRLHYASINAPVLSKLLEPLDSLRLFTLDEFKFGDDCFKGNRVSSDLPNLRCLELLRLPVEHNLEHVEAFMEGGRCVRGVTLTATRRDPDLCCPLHLRRKPQDSEVTGNPSPVLQRLEKYIPIEQYE